jgi:hypothetical protein
MNREVADALAAEGRDQMQLDVRPVGGEQRLREGGAPGLPFGAPLSLHQRRSSATV